MNDFRESRALKLFKNAPKDGRIIMGYWDPHVIEPIKFDGQWTYSADGETVDPLPTHFFSHPGIPKKIAPVDELDQKTLDFVIDFANNKAHQLAAELQPTEPGKSNIPYRIERSKIDAWQSIRDQLTNLLEDDSDD